MGTLLYAEERGATREALQMGAMVAAMFIAAGDGDTAHEALDVLKRVQPLLRTDFGVSELI